MGTCSRRPEPVRNAARARRVSRRTRERGLRWASPRASATCSHDSSPELVRYCSASLVPRPGHPASIDPPNTEYLSCGDSRKSRHRRARSPEHFPAMCSWFLELNCEQKLIAPSQLAVQSMNSKTGSFVPRWGDMGPPPGLAKWPEPTPNRCPTGIRADPRSRPRPRRRPDGHPPREPSPGRRGTTRRGARSGRGRWSAARSTTSPRPPHDGAAP